MKNMMKKRKNEDIKITAEEKDIDELCNIKYNKDNSDNKQQIVQYV